jgi:hypothetical protein
LVFVLQFLIVLSIDQREQVAGLTFQTGRLASTKGFRPRDGSGEPPAPSGGRNRETDFHGQKRSNKPHASTTDPEARLYRKGPGKETKLCFMGHALMELARSQKGRNPPF